MGRGTAQAGGMNMAPPQPDNVFASLPMYDWPEVAGVWDRLWALARDRLALQGIGAEARLRRPEDIEACWRDPRLILGQTCGWPYVSQLRGIVFPFARFDFALGGLPGDYHSVFIAAEEADPSVLLAGEANVVAINGVGSQSGLRALSELAPGPAALERSRVRITGSHRASIRAVAEGEAAIAAIDAMSWRLAMRFEPAAQQVVVCGRSSPVPGLPLVTAWHFREQAPLLFAALAAAAEGLAGDDRETLGLAGVVAAADEDYRMLEQEPFGRLAITD